MTPEEILDQKQIAYYASSVDAWYNTSLERDKSLLTLSAGGIGLLITLLTTVGLSSAETLFLYVGAIACFVVALIVVLRIFHRNKNYIEEIILCKDMTNAPHLATLDKIAFGAFMTGVVFTALIGVTAATDSLTLKEQTMANELKGNPHSAVAQDSFHGVSNLNNPVTGVNKSFNGAHALAPQPIASSPSPTPGATPAAPASSGTADTPNQGSDGK